jgi:hypothetical protein
MCFFPLNSAGVYRILREFYSSIKQEVDRVSYLNSAVPYSILNHSGKNSADPLSITIDWFSVL